MVATPQEGYFKAEKGEPFLSHNPRHHFMEFNGRQLRRYFFILELLSSNSKQFLELESPGNVRVWSVPDGFSFRFRSVHVMTHKSQHNPEDMFCAVWLSRLLATLLILQSQTSNLDSGLSKSLVGSYMWDHHLPQPTLASCCYLCLCCSFILFWGARGHHTLQLHAILKTS